MQSLWGYSDFLSLLDKRPIINDGIVVDTNILISATYEGDVFNEQTNELFDLVMENKIPLFYNVNVKSEFLEIQRRISFTLGLLSFEADVKFATLPSELARRLGSIRANQTKRENAGRSNLRLSESEIKEFKSLMICEEVPSGNLWRAFCRQYIGSELLESWDEAVSKFGLNALSLRAEDHNKHILNPPIWEDAIELMSSRGFLVQTL